VQRHDAAAGTASVARRLKLRDASMTSYGDARVSGDLELPRSRAVSFNKPLQRTARLRSLRSLFRPPLNGAYAASKAAVRAFARGWTTDLAPRGIRVNVISPGPIDTPALEKAGLSPEQVAQAAAHFAAQVPMGRRGRPEEIAAAVVFFASDESSFVTGVDLAVDGGMAQV
jgi:NAD(P)-dependent dehydrogenase (short-subunit alcohol dehydrogenase family)